MLLYYASLVFLCYATVEEDRHEMLSIKIILVGTLQVTRLL